MSTEKNILVVEDSNPQRKALHSALKMRGFSVSSTGDIGTARKLARELEGKLDVVVLDMRLEDKQDPTITGADLGS